MNIVKITLGIMLTLCMGSCAKEEILPGAASLTVIHAIVGAESLRTNFKETAPIRYSTANVISYGFYYPSYNRFSLAPGHSTLGLYQNADTLADSRPLFLLDMNLPVASIHTLFLTGTVDAPESLLVKDDVPFYVAGDSTMGIRFINLSPGSSPISVNLVDRESGSEVAELAYKEITDFQRYAVRKGIEDCVFEFRCAETSELIASYKAVGIGNDGTLQPNTWLYRNFTLALIGRLDGTGDEAPSVLLVPYY